jgi:hypothetical protein
MTGPPDVTQGDGAMGAIDTGLVTEIATGAAVMSANPAGKPGAAPKDAATFTKWITEFPNMAGTVGGSVGKGAYSGKVLDYNPGPTTVIAATYHFGGSDHEFTALMHVEQTGLEAVLVGVVIDGWQKGKRVTGAFTQDTCAHDGTTTDCFRGYVQVAQGE